MKNVESLLVFFAVSLVVSAIIPSDVGAVHNGHDQFQEGSEIARRMFEKWDVPYGAGEDVSEQHFFRVTEDGVEYQVTFYYSALTNQTAYGYNERPSEEWLREVEEEKQNKESGKLVVYEPMPVIYSGTKEAWDNGLNLPLRMLPEDSKKYVIVIVTDKRIETFDDAVRHSQTLLGDNPDSSVEPEAVRRFREVGLSPDKWEWEIQPPSENKGRGYQIVTREKDEAAQDELNAPDDSASQPENGQVEAAQSDNNQDESEKMPNIDTKKTEAGGDSANSPETVVKSEITEPDSPVPKEETPAKKDSEDSTIDKNKAEKESEEKKGRDSEQPEKGGSGNFVGRLISALFSVFRR